MSTVITVTPQFKIVGLLPTGANAKWHLFYSDTRLTLCNFRPTRVMMINPDRMPLDHFISPEMEEHVCSRCRKVIAEGRQRVA